MPLPVIVVLVIVVVEKSYLTVESQIFKHTTGYSDYFIQAPHLTGKITECWEDEMTCSVSHWLHQTPLLLAPHLSDSAFLPQTSCCALEYAKLVLIFESFLKYC